MPIDYKKYPKNWKEIVAAVRKRSGDQCECTGECKLHCTHPGPRRCEERNGEPATWANGHVVLTCAHLDYKGGPCDCEARTGKICGNLDHLKAMCQRCHNRVDVPKRRVTRSRTLDQKKSAGNLQLL